MSTATLGDTVALVLQDVVLFEGSFADNLRLGRPGASLTEVEAAARAARAHDVILAHGGYDARIGPGGAGLSGGERQRIAIARALLKDAPVLVLDEATAQLDPVNEIEIQAAISALIRGRTVIVIAHRLRMVRAADDIWVMEDGRIVERGRHDELMAGTAAMLPLAGAIPVARMAPR
jgi:ATP-binding cassette subfamily B protein